MTTRTICRFGPALILLTLGIPGSAVAQEPYWGGALVERIDSLATATLEGGPVAALGIGVKRGDQLLLARGYGLADVENGVAATSETVHRIGSITKQFTAAAVMQLVEQGAIELEAPMTDYLPDFPVQGHVVTIRHLLTHTSGIKSYTSLETWQPKMRLDLTDDELVALFQDEPFDFAPGERFLYNNSGYYLLGMIVEAASGQTYREYLNEHLFGALGLTGSSYCDERPIIPRRAEGYEIVDGELMNDSPLSMNQPGAAGALCSTIVDMLSWASALRAGDVVSHASYEQMTTPFTLNDGSATGYGFGLGVGELDGHTRISHGGGINGFNTMLAHYPDAGLDVVVFANTNGPFAGDVAEVVARWALGLEVETVADLELAADALSAYEGVYELRTGFELNIFSRDGQLWSQATGQGEVRLRAQGDHRFIPTFDDAVTLTFTVEDGTATSVALVQGGRTMEAPRMR
jgi:CubicO group peptidase (beta-lactamase class C family)